VVFATLAERSNMNKGRKEPKAFTETI